jgi:hypothetical protein
VKPHERIVVAFTVSLRTNDFGLNQIGMLRKKEIEMLLLNTFPGIWFVTSAEDQVVAASENYDLLEHGEWRTLHSITLDYGFVVHWLIPTGRC